MPQLIQKYLSRLFPRFKIEIWTREFLGGRTEINIIIYDVDKDDIQNFKNKIEDVFLLLQNSYINELYTHTVTIVDHNETLEKYPEKIREGYLALTDKELNDMRHMADMHITDKIGYRLPSGQFLDGFIIREIIDELLMFRNGYYGERT